jgi:hypothetical protein
LFWCEGLIGFRYQKFIVEHLDDLNIIGKMMEETEPTIYCIELLKCSVLADIFNSITKILDVLPENQVNPTNRIIQYLCLVDTQGDGAILVYLSLVGNLAADSISTHTVVATGLHWNIVLQIVDLMFVYEIVDLSIHSSHDVVFWSAIHFEIELKHGVFVIFGEIPS